MADEIWLPCPFCGAPAIEARWPDHRGCSDPTCGAHMANLSREQWNRRPVPPTPERRSLEPNERTPIVGIERR
jgi:hypothetical protein